MKRANKTRPLGAAFHVTAKALQGLAFSDWGFWADFWGAITRQNTEPRHNRWKQWWYSIALWSWL